MSRLCSESSRRRYDAQLWIPGGFPRRRRRCIGSRGASLFEVAGSIETDRAGRQLARFLAACTTRRRVSAPRPPSARFAVLGIDPEVPPAATQETTRRPDQDH
jgi:hypothetical protein